MNKQTSVQLVEILILITLHSHLLQVGNQRRILTQTRYNKKRVTNRDKGKKQVKSVKEIEITSEKYTWCPINIA